MSIKLLIADDEDTIRNGIIKYVRLHTDRFDKIYAAEDGQEALNILFKHRPDIMFLDVQMPVKTGIEVMEEAKKAGILPYTLVLSGYEEFAYCQKAFRLGAKDYLLKPVRSSDLLQLLNTAANELLGIEQEEYTDLGSEKSHIVEMAREYITEHYDEDLTLADLAKRIGITEGYLSTLFKKQMGKGFIDYLNEVRVERACTYLRQNYFKTYEIAYKVGFHDEKYFSKVFKKVTGISPSEYRKSK